jgi:spore coat protein U-like protein
MKRLLLSMTCLGLGAMTLPAFAQTATGNMAVTAEVTKVCTIAATDMAFPAYSQTANADTSSLVTVQCTGTSGALGFTVDDGANFLVSRRLTDATNYLNYTIAVTQGAAAIANATAVPVTVSAVDGSGTATLFGRIPAQGNKPAGNYTDTVVVTLTY